MSVLTPQNYEIPATYPYGASATYPYQMNFTEIEPGLAIGDERIHDWIQVDDFDVSLDV